MSEKEVAEEFREATPQELRGKGPGDLVDLYIRRSKKRETVETLKQHARDLRREMDRQGLTVRKVWLEQRSASKAHVRRAELEGAMAAGRLRGQDARGLEDRPVRSPWHGSHRWRAR